MDSIQDLAQQLNEFRDQARLIRNFHEDLCQRHVVAQRELDELKDVQRVLQEISDRINSHQGNIITNLGTVALQQAFPSEDLTLYMEYLIYKGKPAVNIQFHDRRRGVIDDPGEAAGGGPSSLIGIILRVLTIVRQPGMERLLILDEPLVQVSSRYRRHAARLLRHICEPIEKGGLGFHMLVVTHSQILKKAAHRYYHASTGEGRTNLTVSRQDPVDEIEEDEG
jgi:hypothetical protein